MDIIPSVFVIYHQIWLGTWTAYRYGAPYFTQVWRLLITLWNLQTVHSLQNWGLLILWKQNHICYNFKYLFLDERYIFWYMITCICYSVFLRTKIFSSLESTLWNVNIFRKTIYRMFSRLRGNDINIAPQSLSNENFLNILSINYVFCFAICQFLMNKYFFDYWYNATPETLSVVETNLALIFVPSFYFICLQWSSIDI